VRARRALQDRIDPMELGIRRGSQAGGAREGTSLRKRADGRSTVTREHAVSFVGGDDVTMESALNADRRAPARSAHCSSQAEREEMEKGELGTEVSSAATACPE
jgi:hypothetical protein